MSMLAIAHHYLQSTQRNYHFALRPFVAHMQIRRQ
jgi:hypothetical protein